MHTNHFSRIIPLGLFASVALGATACGVDASSADDEEDVSSTSASATVEEERAKPPTGACTVVSGVNRGRHGQFNEDGDCAGKWGMSECKKPDGTDSGKCRAGHIDVRRLPRPARPSTPPSRAVKP